MSDVELRELVASLARGHAETEAAQQETARELREVGRQIGYLGNKFGSFTEGLAFESVEKILRKRFHADTITRRFKAFRGARAQEYDLVGLRNGVHNEVYCVEIKSRLDHEELHKSLEKFREFFDLQPQYRGMKLYGIIAAVDVRGALADRVAHEGLYLATAGDENFKLVKPKSGFKPRVFTSGKTA
ncbi:MAG: DUF3782 domain-containing protein [Verrucomicrobia bacterium]|nr:MAG: DUF3782 domain-containing protein [Verrucomicrobiota bacterium]